MFEALENSPRMVDYFGWNAFRSDRLGLLYVATPKVACSSIKWWFAALEGIPQDILHAAASEESDPDLVIHDVFRKVAPHVNGLTVRELGPSMASEKYFRFCLVRNPYGRIFSAWQSKILLREPLQIENYLGLSLLSLPIETRQDIALAFEAFLMHLRDREAPDFWDIHWAPQFNLLHPDKIKYSVIAKLEDTVELEARLGEHLGAQYSSPFAAKRANESLIPFSPDFITPRSAELIEELYAQDFAYFGYDKVIPAARGNFSEQQLAVAVSAIMMIRGRHMRLRETRARFRDDLEQMRQQTSTLEVQLATFEACAANQDAELASCRAQILTLQEQLNESRRELDGQAAKLEKQQEDMVEHVANIARLTGELTGLYASSSWRLTWPLRMAKQYLLSWRAALRRVG